MHMLISLISTMGTTRHPHRLLYCNARKAVKQSVSRPPSLASFLSFSDVNNAYHYDPGRYINVRQVKSRACPWVCVISVRCKYGVKGVNGVMLPVCSQVLTPPDCGKFLPGGCEPRRDCPRRPTCRISMTFESSLAASVHA